MPARDNDAPLLTGGCGGGQVTIGQSVGRSVPGQVTDVIEVAGGQDEPSIQPTVHGNSKTYLATKTDCERLSYYM